MNTKNNFIRGAWRIMLALVFALSIVGIPSGHASAGSTLTVNSNGDGVDVTPGNGVCETGTGNGVCTLRAAMEEANSLAGADTINFSVGWRITLGSSLPTISEQLTINGNFGDISGNDQYRVMQIASGVNVALDSLNIINGYGGVTAGGGILNYGTLSVTQCTFRNNQALDGGAIHTDTGTLNVYESIFENNSATQYGGALAIVDGSLAVQRSSFSGNIASLDGGAIWGDQNTGANTMTVTNSTFSGNSATGYGGGVENLYGTLTVTNSTFSGNSAGYGSGIDNQGTLHLKNTILANSTSGGDCRSVGGLASNVNNLIESNTGCGTPLFNADPKLASLSYNGGWAPTIALLYGSPAIDAGDDATCAATPVSNLDQRNVARPQGAHCDIGSYEKIPGTTYTVINTHDSGAGSLRQAILDANANTPIEDTINFSVSGMIVLGSSLPDIADDLIIDSSGQSISISGNSLNRVMHINIGMFVTLNNLGIYAGSASGTYGGGIYNEGTLTVTNCSFTGNSATSGGAIAHTSYGTLTVTNSTFTSNYGQSGGAIYSSGGTLGGMLIVTNSTFTSNTTGAFGGGIVIHNSSMTVTNSTFSGNGTTGSGGGIWINNYSNPGTLTVLNSTFVSNTSSDRGGGISINNGTLTVANSTFSGNSATTSGGGIDNNTGALTVANSTFSGNSAATGGGIHNDNSLYLMNTILANSTSGGDCESVAVPAAGTNNLIVTSVNCGTPLSSADPNLGPLADNGGPTQTFALLEGSPAIDAGDDATCAAAPVSNKDQRGVTRPFGAHCDIGSYELNKGSLTIRSVGANDGWILESAEASNVGGTLNSTGTTFSLGDEALDKQYRAILSFNTGGLPDNAVITKVTLKIKRPATGFLVGNNSPFPWGLGLKVDVCRTFFGTTAALQSGDFNFTNVANCKLLIGTFGGTPMAYWYTANILGTAFTRINKTGTTQFRLRFAKDDNDDGNADYMKFYSGNYATATARPTLVIEYYIP